MGGDVRLRGYSSFGAGEKWPAKLNRVGCRAGPLKICNETVQDPRRKAVLVVRPSFHISIQRGQDKLIPIIQQIPVVLQRPIDVDNIVLQPK